MSCAATTVIAAASLAVAVGGTAYGVLSSKPSGGGAAAPPVVAPTPTPTPPIPNRSNADIQDAAETQRRKFGTGGPGVQNNNPTGGLGVPQSSTYSAVTTLLGGGST